jgi:hypothetical protein
VRRWRTSCRVGRLDSRFGGNDEGGDGRDGGDSHDEGVACRESQRAFGRPGTIRDRGGAAILGVLVTLGPGCDRVDLERMIDQRSQRAYEESSLFSDGMAMRQPPPGTVPRERKIGSVELLEGRRGDAWVTTIPVFVDRALLERGASRFRIFCAVCHGARGDGSSRVARDMTLRPPPDLLVPPYRDEPAGRIYAVVSEGYGLMPSHAGALSIEDRWAVVAYLQALQLGQRMRIEDLPVALREEAAPWLDSR